MEDQFSDKNGEEKVFIAKGPLNLMLGLVF